MELLVREDNNTHTASPCAWAAFKDAKERDMIARHKHKALFDTDAHVDRVVAACDILKAFFGHSPNYITARGLGARRPFENIKYQDVGGVLSKKSVKEKNTKLYKPLLDMGNTEVISKNGHLIVRVY
jgi:hypothetical protein